MGINKKNKKQFCLILIKTHCLSQWILIFESKHINDCAPPYLHLPKPKALLMSQVTLQTSTNLGIIALSNAFYSKNPENPILFKRLLFGIVFNNFYSPQGIL